MKFSLNILIDLKSCCISYVNFVGTLLFGQKLVPAVDHQTRVLACNCKVTFEVFPKYIV